VAQTLRDCTDIELFEQIAIQNIIDYKWDTYARTFFLTKFWLYSVFLLAYYADIETICASPEPSRHKNFSFWLYKGVCTLINVLFFMYELIQMRNDGFDYFTDSWNYLELAGNFLY